MDACCKRFRSSRPPLITGTTMKNIYVILVLTIVALVLITSDRFEAADESIVPVKQDVVVAFGHRSVDNSLDDYTGINQDNQQPTREVRLGRGEDTEEEETKEEEEELEECPRPPNPKCCGISADSTLDKYNKTLIKFFTNSTMVLTWRPGNKTVFGILMPDCSLNPAPTPDLLDALKLLPRGTILLGVAEAELSQPLKKGFVIQKIDSLKQGVFAFVIHNGNRGDSWSTTFQTQNTWWKQMCFSNPFPIRYDLPSWKELHTVTRDTSVVSSNCSPLYAVAVIVPYRQRDHHLKMFINNMDIFLSNQSISFTIYVVEHACPTMFNRGILHNIGYKEAISDQHFDCFVFHDVDLIPEKMENYYHCGNSPQHLVVTRNRTRYIMFSTRYFGGAVMFSPEHYELINGFTNKIFGWGGEDNNAFYRVKERNLTISRYSGSVASYTMFEHGWDAANARNNLIIDQKEAEDPTRDPLISWVFDPEFRSENDGLSTLEYSLIWKKRYPRFIHVFTAIPGPLVPNEGDCVDSRTIAVG